jgi:hypothetical protein
MGVNPKIKLVESVQLFWWFGLFHVPIQCGASNPKGNTDFWDGMTLVSKHAASQRHFPIRFEFSRSPADTSSSFGRR